MIPDKIRSHLMVASALPSVDLHYYDLTIGETTECFVVIGDKEKFLAIEIFCAAAIDAIWHYRSKRASVGDWDSDSLSRLSQLEAFETPPPAGIGAPESMMEPGRWHFPSRQTLGFDPPKKIKERLTLDGIFGCVEQCTVGESSDFYVLCFWYTTG